MTERSERRYCQRKGCRGWWVHVPRLRGGMNRLYCEKCRLSRRSNVIVSPETRQRRLIEGRRRKAGIREDRVGLRVDRPRYPRVPCERCMERPARENFSYCMKCSVCAFCGKGKPEKGRWFCRACRLSRNRRRLAYRLRVEAMDRRVCVHRGCTKRLAGKKATAIYCSGTCRQRAGRIRRKVCSA